MKSYISDICYIMVSFTIVITTDEEDLRNYVEYGCDNETHYIHPDIYVNHIKSIYQNKLVENRVLIMMNRKEEICQKFLNGVKLPHMDDDRFKKFTIIVIGN